MEKQWTVRGEVAGTHHINRHGEFVDFRPARSVPGDRGPSDRRMTVTLNAVDQHRSSIKVTVEWSESDNQWVGWLNGDVFVIPAGVGRFARPLTDTELAAEASDREAKAAKLRASAAESSPRYCVRSSADERAEQWLLAIRRGEHGLTKRERGRLQRAGRAKLAAVEDILLARELALCTPDIRRRLSGALLTLGTP